MKAQSQLIVCLAGLAGAGAHARAQVSELSLADIGAGASVEAFEDIVGTLAEPDPFYVGFGSIPSAPVVLPSGVSLAGFGSEAFVYDGDFDPNALSGWGLSVDPSGNLHGVGASTVLPSGNSFFAHDNFDDPSIGVTFAFAQPVSQVGAFVEGNQFDGMSGVTLEAFDTAGVSLGSVSLASTDGVFYDSALDSWIGLSSDSSIGSVTFFGQGLVLDNLTWVAVPAPSSAVVLGFAGVLSARRRRN